MHVYLNFKSKKQKSKHLLIKYNKIMAKKDHRTEFVCDMLEKLGYSRD